MYNLLKERRNKELLDTYAEYEFLYSYSRNCRQCSFECTISNTKQSVLPFSLLDKENTSCEAMKVNNEDYYLHSFISPSLLLDNISFIGRSMFFKSKIASYCDVKSKNKTGN